MLRHSVSTAAKSVMRRTASLLGSMFFPLFSDLIE